MPPEFDRGPSSPPSHPASTSHPASDFHAAHEPAAKRLRACDSTPPPAYDGGPPSACDDAPPSAPNNVLPVSSALDPALSLALPEPVDPSPSPLGLEVLAMVCTHLLAPCSDTEQEPETPPAIEMPGSSNPQDRRMPSEADGVEGRRTLTVSPSYVISAATAHH